MATIIVKARDIIDHANEDGQFKVTSFSWSDTGRYNRTPECEVELDLDSDLEYDDDNYVTIEEYQSAQQDVKALVIEAELATNTIAHLEEKLLAYKNEAELAKQMLEDVLKLQAATSKPKRKWLWF